MIKKIFGSFFIVIASILGLAFVINLIDIINLISSGSTAYSIGYFIGSSIPLILGILLFRLGLKWVQKKTPVKMDTIDDIGKTDNF